MRKAVSKFIKNNKKATFVLQLTAMVDMFTILIVFLLKSFDTSPVQVPPGQNMVLPQSYSITNPEETLKIVISKNSILVDNKKIAEIKDGKLSDTNFDLSDPKFIKPLFAELDSQAQKTINISKHNSDTKFEGKVLLQADQDLPYETIEQVLYTSSMAGYTDMKMATMTFE